MKLAQEPVRRALAELRRANAKAFDLVLEALRDEAETATTLAIEGACSDRESRCGAARVYRDVYTKFRAARED